MKFYSYLIPNLYINTLLIYIILYLFIEAVLWLFKIRSPIWQITLRLIPILKVIIDPFQYHFSNWAFLNGISFFDQIRDSRRLVLEAFIYDTKPGFGGYLSLDNSPYRYALLDPFFEKWGLSVAIILTGAILGIVLFQFTQWIVALYKEKTFQEKEFSKLDSSSWPLNLKSELEKHSVAVVVSQRDYFSPYITVFGKKRIVLPASALTLLDQEELLAVVAHELAHLNKGILLALIASSFLQNIFSFVRLKQFQFTAEKWCDAQAIKNGASRHSLIKAISKMSSFKSYPLRLVPQFTSSSYAVRRIRSIDRLKTEHWLKTSIQIVLLGFLLLVMLYSHIGHF